MSCLTACTTGTLEGPALPAPATSASTPIALSPDGKQLWVVNPDADSVTVSDVGEGPADITPGPPIPVGGEPWAVAITRDGTALVMNRRSGSLSFVSADGGPPDELRIGPELGGLTLSADGELAYVTVSGDASVAVIDVQQRAVLGRVAVGPQPWAIAVAPDGRVVVSHRLARPTAGVGPAHVDDREAWLSVLSGTGAALSVEELVLARSPFGFGNGLESLAVARGVVYIAHLLDSPEPPNAFNTSVSAGLSAVDLSTNAPSLSLDINDPAFSTPVNFPRALAVSPDGEVVYVALAGTDAVMGVSVRDPHSPRLLGFWPTGSNPRGVAISHDGSVAYVMNYLSRDVSVLDLRGGEGRIELARVRIVGETLSPDMHRGKVLFNKANDPRLSRNGWISCASCHLDGGGDGTTWPREEGARQTMPLWSLAGTAPFHAAATRDEIQDFEVDIERFMGGYGLAPGAAGPLLGEPSAGTSADLDALAAFVLHGMRPPTAPTVEATSAQRGRAVFEQRGCQTCHAGPAWTGSALPGEPGTSAPGSNVVGAALHDVGTFDPAHDLTGAAGFDVPTLLGLAYTAPYFHDGSAATLFDVLAHEGHSGSRLDREDEDALVAFLLSIDADAEPFFP